MQGPLIFLHAVSYPCPSFLERIQFILGGSFHTWCSYIRSGRVCREWINTCLCIKAIHNSGYNSFSDLQRRLKDNSVCTNETWNQTCTCNVFFSSTPAPRSARHIRSTTPTPTTQHANTLNVIDKGATCYVCFIILLTFMLKDCIAFCFMIFCIAVIVQEWEWNCFEK